MAYSALTVCGMTGVKLATMSQVQRAFRTEEMAFKVDDMSKTPSLADSNDSNRRQLYQWP